MLHSARLSTIMIILSKEGTEMYDLYELWQIGCEEVYDYDPSVDYNEEEDE